VRASGRYVVVGDSEVFDDAGRIVEVDFGVDDISLVVWDRSLLETVIAGAGSCGGDATAWEVGIERNVTATEGCAALGVVAPRDAVPQVLAAERRHHQHVTLLVGEAPSLPVRSRFPGSGHLLLARPTSFQPPLTRCDAAADDADRMKLPGSGRGDGTISRRIWRHVTSSAAGREVAFTTAIAGAAAAAGITVLWTVSR